MRTEKEIKEFLESNSQYGLAETLCMPDEERIRIESENEVLKWVLEESK